jgi:hypothetical protein
MSFDPYGYSQDQPNQPPGPGGPTPEPAAPPSINTGEARQRVQLPAMALIIVGVINLLLGLGMAFAGYRIGELPPEQLERQMEQQYAKQWADAKKQGYTINDILNIYRNGGLGGGGVALVCALLTIAAGIRMFNLKSYGLAVLASVVMAVPCISPSACCCLGEVIGIWSLVVLLQTDVRAAFR